MTKLIVLGSSNALSSKENENTHMVLIGEERTVMIDCVNNPIHRLEQADVKFSDVTDLVLTHFHPDHVSGVPLLLMDMWLRGRTELITIYGLHYTLDRMEQLMAMYSWGNWPNFFPVAEKGLTVVRNYIFLVMHRFRCTVCKLLMLDHSFLQ